MLVAEMVNTAIEALCDFVEAGHNEKIGIIKDVASASVGIGILVWSVTLLLELSACGGGCANPRPCPLQRKLYEKQGSNSGVCKQLTLILG